VCQGQQHKLICIIVLCIVLYAPCEQDLLLDAIVWGVSAQRF